MIRFEQISYGFDQAGRRAGETVAFVRRQPSWIMRLAVLAALIVIGLPILILVLAAIFAATAVFFVLSIANAINRTVRRWIGLDSTGRSSNIRVIERRG